MNRTIQLFAFYLFCNQFSSVEKSRGTTIWNTTTF